MNKEAFDGLILLAKAVMAFSAMIFSLSIIFALATQAVHEFLRRRINRYIVQAWLRTRKHSLSIDELMCELGYISEKSLFSMPYWQMTGQFSSALSAKLNINPYSKLVFTLADTDKNFELEEVGIKKEDVSYEVLKTRAIASRAQNGIHALHSTLRFRWNVFDYYFSFIFVYLWMVGFFVVSEVYTPSEPVSSPQAGVFLVIAGFFSWLATPVIRRTIENYVPFR